MASFAYATALILLLTNPEIKEYHDQAGFIAEDHGIDVDIFRSLIFLESWWDTGASNGNCYGLGQIKESTASEMAGIPISGEMLLEDPIFALEMSACYLAYCLERAKGDMMLALSLYRHGPWSGTKRDTRYSKAVIKIYYECYSQENYEQTGEDYDFSNTGFRNDRSKF